MKKYLILIISIYVTFAACHKEGNDSEPPTDSDFLDWSLYGASAVLNGEVWNGNFCSFNESVSGGHFIRLERAEWFDNLIWASREALIIDCMKLSKNDTIYFENMPIDGFPKANVFTSGGEGDSAKECFDILDDLTFPSWIVLHQVEEDWIAGHGQLLLYAPEGCANPRLNDPDTLKFENLQFLAGSMK